MPEPRAACRPARVLARCAGLGAGVGGLIGLLALVTFVVGGVVYSKPDALGGLVLAPFAFLIGSVIGTACGVAAFVALLLARACKVATGGSAAGRTALHIHPRCVSMAAGSGSAFPPAAFAVVAVTGDASDWAIAWLCVAVLALATGLTLGPYLMYGSARTEKRPIGTGAATYTRR